MTDKSPAESTLDLASDDEHIDLSDIQWDDAPVLVVFWTLAFVVFLQFFTRYVLNNSLGWTEEIARFLLIAVTFIGAIMAVRKGSHIAVEILYRWFPRPLRRVLQTVVDVAAVVFYGALTWYTYQLAGRTFQMMVSIDVPKSWLYYGIAVCFALMTVYAVIVALRHLVSGSSRLIDPALHEATPSME
ncbi:TRAP transporter small permease [Acuticoccus sediminis]|uniref:TRAP transporter small permease protein n=1 Tax=Acuticoccus sediminis TaxID=2184697 RepID=A0A8B2NZG4_9HYPH|nr:TRAP transporter small permease [Acuticoccus sediminis]RAI03276.1 TRAP transporter small permease [Acuticoccus sediminis]